MVCISVGVWVCVCVNSNGFFSFSFFENHRKNKYTVWMNAECLHSAVGGATLTTN